MEKIQRHCWKGDFFARVLFNKYDDGRYSYLGAQEMVYPPTRPCRAATSQLLYLVDPGKGCNRGADRPCWTWSRGCC